MPSAPTSACAALLLVAACGARTSLRVGEHASDASVAPSLDAGFDAPDAFSADAFAADAFAPDAFSADAFAADAFAPDAFVQPDAFALDAGDPCAVPTTPLDGPICMRPIFADPPVLSCPGGFVDVVARGAGTLRWECSGRRAEAVFADRVYRGTRTGEAFALCIQTEFDYVDGCHWQSFQRITGALGDAALALSYREQATRGTHCFPPCTADARIELR